LLPLGQFFKRLKTDSENEDNPVAKVEKKILQHCFKNENSK
jgi:hypothetical protein